MKFEKIKVYLTILKLKGRIFYMKYVKIVILAIMEVIADFYNRKYDKR